MRKLFLFFSFITFCYFGIGFYYATYEIAIFEDAENNKPHPYYYDYRGVSHVVTSYSKGSLTPPEILLEAAKANLGFLFFTDLNLLDRPYNINGYHSQVFTFSTQKLSYFESHLLIYTDNKELFFNNLSSANAQLSEHFSDTDKSNREYLAVLAHPFKPGHRWTGDIPLGLDGIEVVNMRYVWQDTWFNDRFNFIWSIFTYPFHPQLSLLRMIEDPLNELKLWDQLNQKSKVLGFLGNETTAKIFKILGLNFTFPSYEKSFNFASNHIMLESELTGQAASDRKKIFGAIKKGNFYFSFDSLGPTKGFAAYIEGNNQRVLMGDQITFTPGLTLKIDLPEGLKVPVSVEIYRSGDLVKTSSGRKTQFEIPGTGQYRVVVKVKPLLPLPDREKWISWIYTNPFYITN